MPDARCGGKVSGAWWPALLRPPRLHVHRGAYSSGAAPGGSARDVHREAARGCAGGKMRCPRLRPPGGLPRPERRHLNGGWEIRLRGSTGVFVLLRRFGWSSAETAETARLRAPQQPGPYSKPAGEPSCPSCSGHPLCREHSPGLSHCSKYLPRGPSR